MEKQKQPKLFYQINKFDFYPNWFYYNGRIEGTDMLRYANKSIFPYELGEEVLSRMELKTIDNLERKIEAIEHKRKSLPLRL